ncbi:MAG: hypothetical protein WA667_30105 [Candidatus Nitrosopolaris sp.]
MFPLLSSRQQQQKHQESKRTRKEKIRKGIKFILSHFNEPVFPRTISSTNTPCYGPKFKIVYNEKEMLRAYEHSNFIDCRVSINPSLNNSKNVNTASADLITFDLYKSVFMKVLR